MQNTIALLITALFSCTILGMENNQEAQAAQLVTLPPAVPTVSVANKLTDPAALQYALIAKRRILEKDYVPSLGELVAIQWLAQTKALTNIAAHDHSTQPIALQIDEKFAQLDVPSDIHEVIKKIASELIFIVCFDSVENKEAISGICLNGLVYQQAPMTDLGKFTNLTTLCLSNNQLESLPREIGQCRNLKWLFLNNNQLQSLPPEIGQLTRLSTLDLSNNQLTTLPVETEHLVRLYRLKVNNNPIKNDLFVKSLQRKVFKYRVLCYLRGVTDLLDTRIPRPLHDTIVLAGMGIGAYLGSLAITSLGVTETNNLFCFLFPDYCWTIQVSTLFT